MAISSRTASPTTSCASSAREGALHYRRGPMTTVVMYDEVALSRWINAAVRAARIVPVLGAVLRGVEWQGRRIAKLHCATRFGDLTIDSARLRRCERRRGARVARRAAVPRGGGRADLWHADAGARGYRRGGAALARGIVGAGQGARRRGGARAAGRLRLRLSRARHGARQPHPCRDAARAGGGLRGTRSKAAPRPTRWSNS